MTSEKIKRRLEYIVSEQVFVVKSDNARLVFFFDAETGELFIQSYLGERKKVLNSKEVLIGLLEEKTYLEIEAVNQKTKSKAAYFLKNPKIEMN